MSRARCVAGMTLLVVGLSTGGCKTVKRVIAERLAPSASSAKAVVDKGRPATEAEAASFAEQLRLGVENNRDLSTLVDSDAIIARGFSDLELPLQSAKIAADAMSKKFGQTIAFSMKGGGSYKVLANRVVEGERRVKFRLLGSDGAFNYHDYVVVVRGRLAEGRSTFTCSRRASPSARRSAAHSCRSPRRRKKASSSASRPRKAAT